MKSHRGLSSAVGAIFLIAIVVGALSYIGSSFETMGNFTEQLIIEETRQQNKQNEAYEILSIDINGGKLDGVIKNTGEIPVEVKTLYVDVQGVNDVVQKFTLDTIISPGKTANLIDMVDYTMDLTKGYNMKIVSSRGAVNSFYVNSASQENIDIRLMAIPDTIVTDFDATLLMTVVNNMSNNNILVNLTPKDPYPGCLLDPDCKVTGPEPASYDVLKSGDIAIFKWSYQLSGDEGDTFSFTGTIQNGNLGNDDTTTVTIDVPLYAENSGVSLESLGFGSSNVIGDVFVLHDETFGIPAIGDYQMKPLVSDSTGTPLTFNDALDSWQFFSSNVTATDAHFPAGNWNASLRYYHDHIPSNLDSGSERIWKDGDNGGINLHFEDVSTSTGMYDSGESSQCYDLATSGNTAVSVTDGHSTTMGVNGSGAYYFDGNDDYIRYEANSNGECNDPESSDFSLVMWFKADVDPDNYARQALYWIWDSSGDSGGIRIEIGDGDPNNHGQLFFRVIDEDGQNTVCYGDEPDGNGGENYMDGNWHHVAGTYDNSRGECEFYLDGTLVYSGNSSAEDPLNWNGNEDVYIGNSENLDSDFAGYIDDILFWKDYELDLIEVGKLHNYSFGYNATNLHFTLGNYTDAGVLSNQISYSNDYGLKWGDQGHYTDEWDEYRGGNYTVSLPEVRLNINSDNNRLGFTMSYASGESLFMRIDDSVLSGTQPEEYDLSTYLQPPALPSTQVLPVFYVWSNDDLDVTFFAFSSGDEGAWFTEQGTRIIFNGTGGNYAGLIDTIGNGVDTPLLMSGSQDSPYIAQNAPGNFVFHAPQLAPTKSPVGDVVPAGNYDVTVFLSGYDEDGTVFIRSVNLGTIIVTE